MSYRLNYPAIIVSAILYWLIGALWYSPLLFANAWVAAIGKAAADQATAATAGTFVPYGVALVCNLLVAYVLSLLILHWGEPSAGRGALVGLMAWVGFVATTSLTQYGFEGRPRSLFAINTGYVLVGFVLMGLILGAWKKRA